MSLDRYFFAFAIFYGAVFTVFGQPATNRDLADSLRSAGLKLKNQGDFDSALTLYQQAIIQFSTHDLPIEVADCHNKIGIVYFRMAAYDSALYHYFQSVSINDSLRHLPGLIKNYINLSNYYAVNHDYSNATSFNKMGRALAIELNDHGKLALLLENLGNIFTRLDYKKANPDSARFYFAKSIRIFEEGNNIANAAGGYQNLGLVYEQENVLDSADFYYRKSLQLLKSAKLTAAQVPLHRNLGNLANKLGQPLTALNYFQQGIKLAQQHRMRGSIHSISGNLAEIHELLGNFQKALYWEKFNHTYSDSLFNESKALQISELNTKYETEKTEKELAQAQGEVLRRTAERDGYLYTLAVFLVLAIVLVLVYQQRQKAVVALQRKEKSLFDQRVNQLLLEQEVNSLNAMLDGEEKERKRIAKELHDRVASLLTAIKYARQGNSKAAEDDKIGQLLDDALEETRTLSHSFASGVLAKFGLKAAVEDLTGSIENDHNIQVSVNLAGFNDRINTMIEIDVYRIIQELISNTLKHSKAHNVDLRMNMDHNKLHLFYSDDGSGFDKDVVTNGIGLRNIDARVQKYHGNLHINTEPRQGVKVQIAIPIFDDEKITISG
ncbi:sensor histidine kinase [Fulvivirgaceae bacterium BMA12]|uniref:histidine kinase n=1 Tax=Agaribacillus aureus TaxID=3051825 RepID=A0ABT8LAB5_9BACT|nr:sensor histidine kinase [Fulvivirgaceae bacterium BMA12]